MVFALTLEWARHCFKKGSGWKTTDDSNTNSAQKHQSHCVVCENQNQRIFPLLLEDKNPNWSFAICQEQMFVKQCQKVG